MIIIWKVPQIVRETPHSKIQGSNKCGPKSKNAVDYAPGCLPYENFDVIRLIAKTYDTNLIRLADILEAFLMRSFEAHIYGCAVSTRLFVFAHKDSFTANRSSEVCEMLYHVIR